jgi:hypothetical protein
MYCSYSKAHDDSRFDGNERYNVAVLDEGTQIKRSRRRRIWAAMVGLI